MEFASLHFALFFLIVFILLYALPGNVRWILLLTASLYFYLTWHPVYIFLIIALAIFNYYIGLYIANALTPEKSNVFLFFSLAVNLGTLIVFKYLNFIAESINLLFHSLNISRELPRLTLILPIGISFYTLQAIGYTIDVYKGTQEPEKHMGKFALFLSFFPLLVSGPIERAKLLLPQFSGNTVFDYAEVKLGLERIAWGMFKKVVIADRLAIYVNQVYDHPSEFFGFQVVLAVLFFAFQLYCDFSGYSDIVIGLARVLGYNLTENFKTPYFSTSVQGFWNSWHISLSAWLRDYVFFPLRRKFLRSKNLPPWFVQSIPPLITMLISGLWHGANWTFIFWGGLHGFYLLTENYLKPIIDNFVKKINSGLVAKLYYTLQIGITFSLICFGWIFFRARSIAEAFILIGNIKMLDVQYFISAVLSRNFEKFIKPFIFDGGLSRFDFLFSLFLIIFLLIVEAIHHRVDVFAKINGMPLILRWGFYLVSIFIIILLSASASNKNFIYFQF